MCGLIALTAVFVPALELYVLIEVGARIGALETLALIALTAALGLWAVKGQGLRLAARLREGAIPARAEVLDGPLLLLAALCLLAPGFVSDAVGALLLVPPLRRLLALRLIARFGRPGVDGEIIIVTRRP